VLQEALSMVHSEVVENKHATPRKFLHFRPSWIASGVFQVPENVIFRF